MSMARRSACCPVAVLPLGIQHFADFFHQFGLWHRYLRDAGFAPRGVVLDLAGKALALDQVLDLHETFSALVAALDDGQRRAAAVGVFQLVAEVLFVALI